MQAANLGALFPKRPRIDGDGTGGDDARGPADTSSLDILALIGPQILQPDNEFEFTVGGLWHSRFDVRTQLTADDSGVIVKISVLPFTTPPDLRAHVARSMAHGEFRVTLKPKRKLKLADNPNALKINKEGGFWWACYCVADKSEAAPVAVGAPGRQ